MTLPTSQGSITPIAKSSRRGEGRVTLCSRSRRDPEHQVLVYAYSSSVDRSRSDWYGRPASHRVGTCELCARSKRRSGSPSATRREAESLGCETVQVEGRHPYLVTGAAVLRRSLHARKSIDKRCPRQLRALAPRRGAMLMKSTPATTPVAQHVCCL